MAKDSSPARTTRADGASLRGWLRLARCPRIGIRRAVELVRCAGSADAFAAPNEAALRRAGIPLGTIARLGARALERRLERELRAAERHGFTLLALDDARYPGRLRALSAPPLVLTVAGRTDALSLPAVAIVGSRSATPYGLAHAARLSGPLAARGLAIVSGLARGVDAAAHRAALDANGSTIAVLGSGADRIYPAEHRALARAIARDGALVSEFACGIPPKPGHFPRRNRLIAGLALAVVVVEAAERSGSLVTARWAADEGRALLAAPGRAGERNSAGTLGLLRDGAALACSPEDVLLELPPGERGRSSAPPREAVAAAGAAADLERLTPDARRLFDAVEPHEAPHVDALIDRLGLGSERVLAAAFELEIAGLLLRAPGARFRRAAAAADLPSGPG